LFLQEQIKDIIIRRRRRRKRRRRRRIQVYY
jgi:hypothetical protein